MGFLCFKIGSFKRIIKIRVDQCKSVARNLSEFYSNFEKLNTATAHGETKNPLAASGRGDFLFCKESITQSIQQDQFLRAHDRSGGIRSRRRFQAVKIQAMRQPSSELIRAFPMNFMPACGFPGLQQQTDFLAEYVEDMQPHVSRLRQFIANISAGLRAGVNAGLVGERIGKILMQYKCGRQNARISSLRDMNGWLIREFEAVL